MHEVTRRVLEEEIEDLKERVEIVEGYARRDESRARAYFQDAEEFRSRIAAIREDLNQSDSTNREATS